MKKRDRITHRVGGRPRGVRSLRPDGDHRLGHAVHADLDPVHGHPAVQDGAPERRLVHPDGEGTQLQRRIFRHPRRRQPPAPVRHRADRRRPAVREDPGGNRLRPDLRRGEHPGRPGQVSHLRQLQDRDAGGQHLASRSPPWRVGMYGIGTKSGDVNNRRLHEDRHGREHLLTASSPRPFPLWGGSRSATTG